jgi:NAD(P)-dependent dehydrogenase (short-subunit alcohol dehydrogenase family)
MPRAEHRRPRRAVVTGGAQGIGRELVLGLARRGARVVIADVDAELAEACADEVRRIGGDALALRCDVRDPLAVEQTAAVADRWLGGADLLVNNAGVLVVGELCDLAIEDCQRVMDVNCWGVVHGCRAFVPRMRARGAGAILNVASLSGWITLPQMGIYSATKAAVIALSETLHAELAGSGISVTLLCPSITKSNLVEGSSGAASGSTMHLARRLMSVMGDSPREVADVGLDAVERGRLYAIPTLHGRLAWRTKRWLPDVVQWALVRAHDTLIAPVPPGARDGVYAPACRVPPVSTPPSPDATSSTPPPTSFRSAGLDTYRFETSPPPAS